MAYCGWGVPLMPQHHDDRDDEQLHQPVAGVDRGHFPRRVLPEDRSHENEDGEPDPHQQTEMNRAQHPDNAEQGHESKDYEAEDEAPRKLDDSRYEDSQVVHVQHRASKEWGVRER